jgi:hypothetical protein
MNIPSEFSLGFRDLLMSVLCPARCSAVVRYAQGTARYGRETQGEFRFPAAAVAEEFEDTARKWPDVSWAYGHEAAMLAWIRGRDETRTRPTRVPERWSEVFSYTAWTLLQQGVGVAKCNVCRTVTPASELKLRPTDGSCIGFDSVECPNGHRLLVADRIRQT